MLQCRIGDIGVGVCYSHDSPQSYTTTIISGATDVFTEGPQNAVVTSMGCATCGHTTVALTGSQTVTHDGLASHRLGDSGQNGGPYTMTTSSSTVDVG